MNCKNCQEKILESFAAGEQFLDTELVGHRDSCADCSAFFVKQQSFFESLDAQLQSIANEPVPPFFISSLRTRLAVKDSIVSPRWGLALVSIGAVLVVMLGYATRWPAAHPTTIPLSSTAMRSAPPAVSESPFVQMTPPNPELAMSKSVGQAKRRVHSSGMIVRPEERRAFAQLVAELPAHRNMALALARPAPPPAEDSLEISLLQMDSVEVKPLGAKLRE